MSKTEIRYRLVKEKGPYLENKKETRGFTLIHSSNPKLPFKEVLKEFYSSVLKPTIIHNIKRGQSEERPKLTSEQVTEINEKNQKAIDELFTTTIERITGGV